MPDIGHVILKDETQRTRTSSTYAAPTDGHKFLGANLDPSSDYALIVHANVGGTTVGSANVKARMYDGSALMVGSELIYQPEFTTQARGWNYYYVTKITTPASNIPDYEFQIASANNTDITYVDAFYGVALKLSDMDSADYAYSQDTTGYSSLTAATYVASAADVTIGNGTDDWAIFLSNHYDAAQATRHYCSVMEGGTPVDTDPSVRSTINNAASEMTFGCARWLQAEASETYTVGMRIDGDGSGTCDYTAILAINMTQFSDWMGGYSNVQNDVAAVDTIDQFMSVVTTTVDDGAKDWFVYGDVYWADDGTAGAGQVRITADINNAGEQVVAGLATDGYGYEPQGNGNTMPLVVFDKIESVPGNTELDIDVDGREDLTVAGAPRMRFGGIIAFTFDGPDFPGPGGSGEVFNRVLTENTVVTDPIPGYQLTQERPANSNVELLTDAAFIYYAYGRLIAGNFDLNDQYIMEQNLRRDIAEVVSVDELVSVLRYRFSQLSDAIALSDDFQKTITIGETGSTYSKIRKDALSVADLAIGTFLGINDEQVTDSILLDEAAFLQRFRNYSLVDQIDVLAELMTMAHSKVRRDVFRATDSVVVTEFRIRNVTALDTFKLFDSINYQKTGIVKKRLTDLLSLTDSRSFEQGSTLQPSVRIETGIQER